MSSRSARERASRLAEFREADAAYKETRDPKYAKWRAEAERSKDMRESDTRRANEILTESVAAEVSKNNDLLKKHKFSGWKVEKKDGC